MSDGTVATSELLGAVPAMSELPGAVPAMSELPGAAAAMPGVQAPPADVVGLTGVGAAEGRPLLEGRGALGAELEPGATIGVVALNVGRAWFETEATLPPNVKVVVIDFTPDASAAGAAAVVVIRRAVVMTPSGNSPAGTSSIVVPCAASTASSGCRVCWSTPPMGTFWPSSDRPSAVIVTCWPRITTESTS